MPSYCTQADLEIALGGAEVLVHLSDTTGAGTANTSVVSDYLDSGGAVVRSVVEVKHDPETIANLDADGRRLLRDINKWISARIAWVEGGRGQAMPGRVESMADHADKMLMEIRTGERRLGRVSGGTVAAINQPVGVVDHDDDGSRISFAGFRRGFL